MTWKIMVRNQFPLTARPLILALALFVFTDGVDVLQLPVKGARGSRPKTALL